jgi:hypothetical protein
VGGQPQRLSLQGKIEGGLMDEDELPKKVSKDDRLLIFFSGHGETRKTHEGKKIGYLIPIDGDPEANPFILYFNGPNQPVFQKSFQLNISFL